MRPALKSMSIQDADGGSDSPRPSISDSSPSLKKPSSSTSSSSSDSYLENFHPVIEAIREDNLVSLALKVRGERECQESSQASIATQSTLSCDLQKPPAWGTDSLVYTLHFSDGVKWVARIPGNGLQFSPLDQQKMKSTVETISLIRSKTSIPIPEVYSWASTGETIGVPYTLESFVSGSILAKRWDDPAWTSEEKRLKIFRNLAPLMSQLASMTFDQIGTPFHDLSTDSFKIGPLIWTGRDIFDE